MCGNTEKGLFYGKILRGILTFKLNLPQNCFVVRVALKSKFWQLEGFALANYRNLSFSQPLGPQNTMVEVCSHFQLKYKRSFVLALLCHNKPFWYSYAFPLN